MKILKLSAENIKRLSAIEINPDGSPVIVIGGKNGAGKSSVLDAIAMALGGKDLIPGKPIRRGQRHAKVVVDLGDIVVTRTFTESGGGSLKVSNREGANYTSPQAMLDNLIGRLSFDPLAFERMEQDKQLVTLRRLVGLDTNDLDLAIKAAYDERTAVNRLVKQLEGQLAGITHYRDVPAELISIAALTVELDNAEATRRVMDSATSAYRERVRDHENACEATKRDVQSLERLRQQIQQLETQIDLDRQAEARAAAAVEEATQQGSAARAALVDAAPIRSKIAAADEINTKVRSNTARVAVEKNLAEQRRASQVLSDKIADLAQQKKARIESAAFPVAGLGCDDDGVTFDGLPFEQASQAQRLRVSVAIGLALNPRLKVLLVREGSSLDSDSLRLLTEMAEGAGAQVWLEKVAESRDGVSVLIEDGAIKAEEDDVASREAV